MTKSDLSPLSAPSLSPDLQVLYNGMSGDNKQMFIKVFKYLWRYVVRYKRFTSSHGVLWSYWAVDLLRIRYNLTTTEFSILMYLYQVSDRGKRFVHAHTIEYGVLLPDIIPWTKKCRLSDLAVRGLVSRSSSDPGSPYLAKSYSYRGVFVKPSPEGLKLIEQIEKDLYNILLRSSLDDLTGNKKPDKG